MQARSDNSFVGASFTTDESPPSEARFAGLRFQITIVYLLFYHDVSLWEDPRFDQQYPFRRERHLTDICHCPSKTGKGTLSVIEKQLRTKGVTLVDIVNGCTDGGGENEGSTGIHKLMEGVSEGYVRRRCFGHLSWRTTDAGLEEMDTETRDLRDISSYLRDGVTGQGWCRSASKDNKMED